MTVYLDTSTVLRILLRQPKPLAIWAQWDRAYASELLHVEACRVIDRLRIEGALDDQGVADLQRAALPMATVVKALDAMHLATAMLLRERRGVELSFRDTRPAAGSGGARPRLRLHRRVTSAGQLPVPAAPASGHRAVDEKLRGQLTVTTHPGPCGGGRRARV